MISASQRQLAAFNAGTRGILLPPHVILPPPLLQGPMLSFIESSPMSQHMLAMSTPEMLSHMHQQALSTNPLYQTMPNFHGVAGNKLKKEKGQQSKDKEVVTVEILALAETKGEEPIQLEFAILITSVLTLLWALKVLRFYGLWRFVKKSTFPTSSLNPTVSR